MAKLPSGTVQSEDQALFEEAVGDVRRVVSSTLPPAASAPEPRPLSEEESDVLRHLDQLVAGQVPLLLEDTDEFLAGAVAGLRGGY